jgi:hypothetical protein
VLDADTVAESDDPFFIVPAVVPDDSPVTRSKTEALPRTEAISTLEAHTLSHNQSVNTSSTPPIGDEPASPEPTRRSVSFERPAVRRTTRVLRHIDPWSVFRVTLVFHFVLYLTLLLTGVLLWNVANATGTVDNVERFMESFGWDTFQFKGGELFHQAWVLGLFVVVGMTGLAILAVTTFNLITDLVGGIRVTILEGKPEAKKSPKPAKRPQQSRTSRVDRR